MTETSTESSLLVHPTFQPGQPDDRWTVTYPRGLLGARLGTTRRAVKEVPDSPRAESRNGAVVVRASASRRVEGHR